MNDGIVDVRAGMAETLRGREGAWAFVRPGRNALALVIEDDLIAARARTEEALNAL
ncbi:hypothetical protein ACFV4G_04260 [Kitasatospora sp. NPDC059747]|uniref:hypothetical protein n=1 Tax=Kitasatospora sp. NPDC059747 TaxID=3346930 RepID=UPI0036612379